MRSVLRTVSCGSRARAEGPGLPIHQSQKVINLHFEERVITLLVRGNVLSPSSIIIEEKELPEVKKAWFEDNTLFTNKFTVELQSPEDLRIMPDRRLDAHITADLLRPYVQPYGHSISTPLLAQLFGLPIKAKGLEKAVMLRQAKALSESRALPELVKRLLGLGYGLTPSGDDFVLGIIAVLGLQGLDLKALRLMVQEYDNPFSRTMLLDALDGYFSQPLLNLLRCLQKGECPSNVAQNLRRVGSISGRDTITGMFYAAYLLKNSTIKELMTGSTDRSSMI